MNSEAFHSSVQQMMGGIPAGWWSMNSLRTVPQEISTLLPPSSSSSSPSSSSSSVLPSNVKPGTNLAPMTLWHANQELPESWCQLLMEGVVEEEDASSLAPYAAGSRSLENWEGHHHMVYQPAIDTQMEMDIKQQTLANGCAYYYGAHQEAQTAGRSSWSQLVPPTSSSRSCITTSYSNNMLDFSSCKWERKHHQSDHLSECNSPSGAPFKKAKLQASSAHSPLKVLYLFLSHAHTQLDGGINFVRKEKLGDRITALHQLVSPFGKTDTASVLLEAIGYIRFLQNQIEALSSPYLGNRSRNGKNKGNGESSIFPEDPGQLPNDHCMKRSVGPSNQDVLCDQQKDLRSKGLCLVPVSFTMHVGSENGSDFCSLAFGAGFR